MKIGVLFSGQGSQYPGMGNDLYKSYEPAQKVFDLAGDEIKNWCFEGTKEMLRKTYITQPSVLTVSIAAYTALIDELKKEITEAEISAMAGFSMGEYAALMAAGVITNFDTTLNLIKKRGQFMTEAGLDENGKPKGSMAAAFGKREDVMKAVETFRHNGILECVNFNSPIQTAVAGDISAIERLKDRGFSEFGIKVKALSVSSAFHSPMMESASVKLREELKKYTFNRPSLPVYVNHTGKKIMNGKPEKISDSEWIIDMLSLQIKRPVYWQETIENMRNDGIDIFIEVGPGRTLSSLAAKTVKDTVELHVEDKKSMNTTISRIKEIAYGK